jgi:hypothetical protein
MDRCYPDGERRCVIYAWTDEQVAKVQRIFLIFCAVAGLLAVAGVAHGGIPTVVMGFHSCDDKNRCTYRELVGPDGAMMSCLMHGQQIATQWLTESGMQGHTLKKGWKCYINHSPGEEIPV